MRRRIKAQAGFTLVELLIAVVIMAIGLLGLAQLQITSMRSTSHTSSNLGANALAQRIIAEISSFPSDPAQIVTAGGVPFLSTQVVNDPENPNPANVLIFTDIRPTGLGQRNYSDEIAPGVVNPDTFFEGVGRFRVTYGLTPNFQPNLSLITITVENRTETRGRRFFTARTVKFWRVP